MDFFWIFITEQSVSEEIALFQNADCGFLADLRYDSEPYLSLSYIENSIRRIPLSKDGLPSRKIFDLSSAVDGRKKCLGIEFGEFLRCRHECHNLVPH